MKTMTATEASRHFSDLLDAVERGETITIVRGSRPVAEIGPAHRRTGADLRAALAAIRPAADVLDYTQATAAQHGRLLAHVRRSGAPRGAHDLIIAAHAAETGRTILSRDAKARFGDLPGVSAIDA